MARSSRTRYAVLGMLATAPMTGYALREEINHSLGHFWRESDGQLYPTLRELQAEGLVETVEAPGSGRGRAVHRILPAGRSALRAWLTSEPESLLAHRNELLLQLFFGRHVEPEVLHAKLQQHRERIQALLADYRHLERAIEADPSPDRRYWLVTLRHGIRMAEAQLAWNEDACALLIDGDPDDHH